MPKGSYVGTFKYHEPASPELPSQPTEESRRTSPMTLERTVLTAWRKWRRGLRAAIAIALLIVVMLSFIFSWHHSRQEHMPAPSRGPSVIVHPFENDSADPKLDFISYGLTFEIINSLTRFSDLFVYGPETSFSLNQPEALALSSKTFNANYILSGSVYSTGEAVRVAAILTDSLTHRSVWSASFDRRLTASNLVSMQSDIAESVARAIGQPFGAPCSI